MKDRQAALVDYVSSHGKVEVNQLSEILKISKVTVRKDLDYLSEKGILRRERGYALLNDPEDINYRMAFFYERKLRIAKEAAVLVEDGETIMIEAGSTCVLFAEELAKTKKNIRIITNSVQLANYIKEYPETEVILLGGIFQKKRQAMVGPLTKLCAKEFNVDKIFAGVDGYSREFGFTGEDLIRLDTLKSMTMSAKHVYILTESEKFKKTGTISFLKFNEVYQIITDSNMAKGEKEFLEKQGIKIICV